MSNAYLSEHIGHPARHTKKQQQQTNGKLMDETLTLW